MTADVKIVEKIKTSGKLINPTETAVKIIKYALKNSSEDNGKAHYYNQIISTLLNLLNSTFFGTKQILSVKDALSLLGGNNTHNLITAIIILEHFKKIEHSLIRIFLQRILCNAVVSRTISQKVRSDIKNEVMIAGLLCDLGMFLLLNHYPDFYESLYNEARDNSIDLVTVENSYLKSNHMVIGKHIAEWWQLDDMMLYAIDHHHNPDFSSPNNSSHNETADIEDLVTIVYLGSLASDIFFGWNKSAKIADFTKMLELKFGVQSKTSEEILTRTEKLMKQAAVGFELEISSIDDYTRILHDANSELSELNLKYEEMYKHQQELVNQLKYKNEEFDILTRELSRKNQLLEELAQKDGLTGLYNHRYFQEFVDICMNQYQRHEIPFCIVLLDIDHFKRCNDEYGHLTGDNILIEMGKLLNKSVRGSDIVARYGGEEFVLVLTGTELDGAVSLAEKLRIKIEKHVFFSEKNKPLNITASFGIAQINKKCKSKHNLIEKADKYLYQSKKNGRNLVSYPQK